MTDRNRNNGQRAPYRDANGALINEAPLHHGSYTGWGTMSPSEERHREEQEHNERPSGGGYF